MKKTTSTGLLLVCFGLAIPTSFAADPIEQLKDCARTVNDSDRIACYESLGKSVLATELKAASGPAAATTKQANKPQEVKTEELADSVGGGKYARDAGIPKEQFRGVLKSCEKSLDNRWFYIFENGQIWKQVRHKTIRHKNCNVSVNIMKDGFGYKLQIEGEKRKVRVRRHR